jgi:hypothetical protein
MTESTEQATPAATGGTRKTARKRSATTTKRGTATGKRSTAARRTAAKTSATGTKKKIDPRRGWTDADVRSMKTMITREGISARNIAKKLKRTEGAVRQKAFAEGLSFKKAAKTTRSARTSASTTRKRRAA